MPTTPDPVPEAPVRAAPPGGRALAVAKRLAEHALWTRVAVQRRWESRRGGERSRPAPCPPTDVLGRRADWEAAVAECRRLRLPLHHDRPKNWDALGAVATVLDLCRVPSRPGGLAVLDAGSARYSPVLPWLRLYGLGDLVGNNLEFGTDVRRDGVLFRYGDITATDFPDGRFDAVTCMSVIEHGVPLEPFLAESARILAPGGVLVVSTDYDQDPPDTTGITMYGQQVHIFSPDEIRDLVATAGRHGLALVGELALDHAERPVHWKRTGLDYTFLRLTFRRAG
ncbi:MAG: class I SAM-dependent methyltransferase [Actinomycetales bacterium]|nr:class I SAM-dependent methyltransferase [Actinomycetales bacterium]